MTTLAIGTALTLAATAVSAVGTIAAGQARNRAAQYEGAQLDIKAGEERAAAQRDALQLDKQKRLALSSLMARAAASGFMASDPTVIDIAGEIDEYGTYQSAITRYGGEARAEGLKAQAVGVRAGGRAAAAGAWWDAAGTVLGGMGSAFGKYGRAAYQGRYGGAPMDIRPSQMRGYG